MVIMPLKMALSVTHMDYKHKRQFKQYTENIRCSFWGLSCCFIFINKGRLQKKTVTQIGFLCWYYTLKKNQSWHWPFTWTKLITKAKEINHHHHNVVIFKSLSIPFFGINKLNKQNTIDLLTLFDFILTLDSEHTH